MLALARRAGLPVLPGFVVTAPSSREHMRLGAETLDVRGSGGARLAVAGSPLEPSEELVDAGRRLGPELVARSSTLLEGSGEWAGAFTSFVDLTPEDLPKAVAGVWASAFGVDALERQENEGIEPGSFEMAVLVQPALHPHWGGTAELRGDGSTVIHGVAGSPAPLLQGWLPGMVASGSAAAWEGPLAGDLDTKTLDALDGMLREADSILGANRCEWALDHAGELWLLQLGTVSRQEPEEAPNVGGAREDWLPIVTALTVAPGLLGSELVVPWAIAGAVPDVTPRVGSGTRDLETARELSDQLTGHVWNLAPNEARTAADETLGALVGPDQEESLRRIKGLRAPDPEVARELMEILNGLCATAAVNGLVDRPESAWHLSTNHLRAALEGEVVERTRVGSGRWEPLVAAVVLAHGRRHNGAAAAPGLGAGRVHRVDDQRASPAPRSVLYSTQAAPVLSQLLWDATGVVTLGGSPAAHLFESARAVGVPAVTGVELARVPGQIVAVDGFAGVVATLTVDE